MFTGVLSMMIIIIIIIIKIIMIIMIIIIIKMIITIIIINYAGFIVHRLTRNLFADDSLHVWHYGIMINVFLVRNGEISPWMSIVYKITSRIRNCCVQ